MYMSYVRRFKHFPKTDKSGNWTLATAEHLKEAAIRLPHPATLRRNGFNQKQARDRAVQILLNQ